MYNFIIKIRKIIQLICKVFWFPIDGPVRLWLESRKRVVKFIPKSFKNYTIFLVNHVPTLNYFYSKFSNNGFFKKWFNLHIGKKILYIYIIFCIIAAVCYSIFEIHLVNLFEIFAILELTWLSEWVDIWGAPVENKTLKTSSFFNFFSSKEEWSFFRHLLWGSAFLLVYFLQVLLFALLIFCFSLVVGYFWILYLFLNYFVFLGMFVPYDPTHVTFLNAWHMLASVFLVILFIISCRIFFVVHQFKVTNHCKNYFTYMFFLLKQVILFFSIKFWNFPFYKKIYSLVLWSFYLNFILLLLITVIKLIINPDATGEFLWLLILNLFSPTFSWQNFFIFPWTRLFQVFISIAIVVLYDVVYYTIILGSFYILICLIFVKLISFLSLIVINPDIKSIISQIKCFFYQWKLFLNILKHWIPTLREYCYAGIFYNIKTKNFYVQGIRERRAQRAFWKVYNKNKTHRRFTTLFKIFYDYIVNDITSNAGYKNTFQDNVTKKASIWNYSYIYGMQRRFIKLTKGFWGRQFYIKKNYFFLFKQRFFFFFYKWQKNPGFLGHFLFNSHLITILDKSKFFFFTINFYINNVLFAGKIKILFSIIIFLISCYFLILKWFLIFIALYASIFSLGSYYCPKFIKAIDSLYLFNNNKFTFFGNFCIILLCNCILYILYKPITFIFITYPLLKTTILSWSDIFLINYNKVYLFLYKNKLFWKKISFYKLLKIVLTLNVLFIITLVLGFLICFLDIVGKIILYCYNLVNLIFKGIFLVLIFSPFVIFLDFGLNFFFFWIQIVSFIFTACFMWVIVFSKVSRLFWNLTLYNTYTILQKSQNYLINKKLTSYDYFFCLLILCMFLLTIYYVYFFFLCG